MSQPTLLARKVARELTAEELDFVSAGTDNPIRLKSKTGGTISGTGCSMAPGPGFTYQCADVNQTDGPLPGPGGGDPPGPAAPL
jgi:hypothetical protein